jgi:hypothetical protein
MAGLDSRVRTDKVVHANKWKLDVELMANVGEEVYKEFIKKSKRQLPRNAYIALRADTVDTHETRLI